MFGFKNSQVFKRVIVIRGWIPWQSCCRVIVICFSHTTAYSFSLYLLPSLLVFHWRRNETSFVPSAVAAAKLFILNSTWSSWQFFDKELLFALVQAARDNTRLQKAKNESVTVKRAFRIGRDLSSSTCTWFRLHYNAKKEVASDLIA